MQLKYFNAPILEGWEDQSAEEIAQFHLQEAQATIRTAMVTADEVIAAVEADLAAFLNLPLPQPTYSGKVNLADGTWTVLAYDIDEATTASVMARQADGRVVVISFVERDPAARITLLTVSQADESHEEAGPEIALAIATVAGSAPSVMAQTESVMLPSGEWITIAGEGLTAMGMVFGNDSYVALREGAPGDLAALADAWNRTLLGFFITPDNSRYLALGLAVALVILAALIGSLFWRERGLRKDKAMLEALARAED